MGHVVIEGSVEGERFRPLRFFFIISLIKILKGTSGRIWFAQRGCLFWEGKYFYVCVEEKHTSLFT